MEREPGYYYTITADVMFSKELEPNAKLLHALIGNLCLREGYCWASNAYLAEILGCKERVLQNWLVSLKEAGFIEIDLEASVQGTKRKICIHTIKPCSNGVQKNAGGGCNKMQGGGAEKCTQIIERRITERESISPKPPLPPTKRATPEPSAEASGLSSYFLSLLQKRDETFTPKGGKKWASQMDDILRIDKRSPEEVRQLIDWIQTDGWYRDHILSPARLRKEFSELKMKMNGSANRERIQFNRAWAQTIIQECPDKTRGMKATSKGIVFPMQGKDVDFDMPPDRFKEIVTHICRSLINE